MVPVTDYMASNDSIDEQKIGEDMKGIVCGLI
jgi:hypothetical protein